MYIETEYRIYHSNILGDTIQASHPIAWKIGDRKIDTSLEVREKALENQYINNKKGYVEITEEIKFKIISRWENDSTTSGSRIRWCVPKGSEAIYK